MEKAKSSNEPSQRIPGTSMSHMISSHFWPVKALNRLMGSRVQGAVLGDGGRPPQQKGGPLTGGFATSPQLPVQDCPEFKQNIL